MHSGAPLVVMPIAIAAPGGSTLGSGGGGGVVSAEWITPTVCSSILGTGGCQTAARPLLLQERERALPGPNIHHTNPHCTLDHGVCVNQPPMIVPSHTYRRVLGYDVPAVGRLHSCWCVAALSQRLSLHVWGPSVD